MNHDLICSRYAKALMLAAGDDIRMAQRIARECMLVNDHFQHGLSDVMANPTFSHAERRAVIERICADNKFLGVTHDLLVMLTTRARMQHFPDIFRLFRVELDRRMGRITVSVISSHPLPASLFSEYRRKIHEHYGESALIRQETNPELIGGVLIRVGNKLIDGTMEGSLRRFSDRLNLS